MVEFHLRRSDALLWGKPVYFGFLWSFMLLQNHDNFIIKMYCDILINTNRIEKDCRQFLNDLF